MQRGKVGINFRKKILFFVFQRHKTNKGTITLLYIYKSNENINLACIFQKKKKFRLITQG